MEDLAPQIERYSKLVPLVDSYNRARREFQREEGEVLLEEKEALVAWLEKLKTYPYAVKRNFQEFSLNCVQKDISVEEYGNGTISCNDEKMPWKYNHGKQIVFPEISKIFFS